MPVLSPLNPAAPLNWTASYHQTLRATISVTEHLQLISFNTLTKNGPWYRRKHAAAWRAAGAAAAAAAGLPHHESSPHVYAVVEASIFKTTARRYDPGNLAPVLKWAIDGMVTDHGLLPDDNWCHLDGPHAHHGGIDKAHPRVEFTITTYLESPHA